MMDPDDEEHRQNVGQKYLWECWLALARAWPQLDLLILNGDVIEGCAQKSYGTGVASVDRSVQAECAVRCVRAFRDINKPTKIIRTEGTPYHEGHHQGGMKAFDHALEIPKRRVAHEMLPFDITLADGKILNVKHHPEGSAALYVGTVQDREAIWAVIAEQLNGLPRANFLVRSHLHFFGRLDSMGKTHILTPCFQLASAYARKQRYYRWHPVIGGILLRYDPLHDDRYQVVKTTFPLPERKAVAYEAL